MTGSFDIWLNGAPVVILRSIHDYSIWNNGAPLDNQESANVSFTGNGIATAKATISATVSLSAEGFGIASGTAQLGAIVNLSALGYGVSEGTVSSGSTPPTNISGTGFGIVTSMGALGIAPNIRRGGVRRCDPTIPRFFHTQYGGLPPVYRRTSAEYERVRHLGDPTAGVIIVPGLDWNTLNWDVITAVPGGGTASVAAAGASANFALVGGSPPYTEAYLHSTIAYTGGDQNVELHVSVTDSSPGFDCGFYFGVNVNGSRIFGGKMYGPPLGNYVFFGTIPAGVAEAIEVVGGWTTYPAVTTNPVAGFAGPGTRLAVSMTLVNVP